MGDIPFFYRTKWVNGHFDLEVMAANNFSHINVLGVIPVSIIAASSFSITYECQQHGLKMTWASSRPIINPSHLETDRTRAYNFFTSRREFIELAYVEGIGVPWFRPFERKGHFQRFFEFLGTGSFKAGPFEVSEPKIEKASTVEFGMRYSSAWIKIFDIKAKGSGFIRVWDFSPRIITNGMLDEIYTLLKHYCKEKFQADVAEKSENI